MFRVFNLALICLSLAALVQPALGADDLFSSQLVDQARGWQAKGRDDLAADTWRKLLLIDSKHPEALVKLGIIEARAGNRPAAQDLYNRASQLPKPPAGLGGLSALLNPIKEPAQAPKIPPPPVEELARPTPTVKAKELAQPRIITPTPPAKEISPRKQTTKIAVTSSKTLPTAKPQVSVVTEYTKGTTSPGITLTASEMVKPSKSKPRPCRILPATSTSN
jgi:hypothetical protein